MEPSSYAGLAAVFGAVHLTLDDPMLKAITGVCVAIAGVLGVFLKEKNLA